MITINHLDFSYTGKEPYLLNHINLTVNRGDYISILGDNGTGKSTFIKLILGLLQPSNGEIRNSFRKTGYVPQRFENMNTQFPITVGEMLDCYRKILKIRDKSAVAEALRGVKMEDYRDALIGTLSGGQCQKVFIARAMMGAPELLVFDEPSAGVDNQSQAEIYGLIKAINRERGIAVLSVEHNLKAAIDNSTLIFHLSGGDGHLCRPDEYIREFISANKGGDGDAAI